MYMYTLYRVQIGDIYTGVKRYALYSMPSTNLHITNWAPVPRRMKYLQKKKDIKVALAHIYNCMCTDVYIGALYKVQNRYTHVCPI